MSKRPHMSDCNLFFFDCETGGLSPYIADMVEVACVVTDSTGTKVLDEYSAKVLPEKPVDAKAAEINGYSAEKWAAEAVPITTALMHMTTLARGAVFAAHNVAFDWGFFELALARRAMRWPGDYHRVCTVALSEPLLRAKKVENQKLVTLSKYFGIEHENAHTALADVRACQQVYVKLMGIYRAAFDALP